MESGVPVAGLVVRAQRATDGEPMPRVMEIVTPLGEDVLLFHGMHAREELSRLSSSISSTC